jgi:acyl CoA:acetate/3-ketoacid CoA transferase alpha subunit
MSLRKDLQICNSVDDALKDLKSGASIMAGGFGLAGIPETMIEWTRAQENIKDLYFISTEAGDDNWGLGRLYGKNKISKQSCSYIGRCHVMEKAYLSGQTELEMVPQGTVSRGLSPYKG